MIVNGECWDVFLVVSCQSCCQVNSVGMFSVVKVLNGFWVGWIYVDGFIVIVLVRCYCNGEVYILIVEFFFVSSGFSYICDIGIGNDIFDGSFVGMVQFFGQQCGCSFCYIYCLFFK